MHWFIEIIAFIQKENQSRSLCMKIGWKYTIQGGIYGRMKIDQLGKVQPDTRKSSVSILLEVLNITENRYSGIPTIRMEMENTI